MSGTAHMDTFKNIKNRAIKASKDLCYSADTIHQLQKATTEAEISRIMINARKRGY